MVPLPSSFLVVDISPEQELGAREIAEGTTASAIDHLADNGRNVALPESGIDLTAEGARCGSRFSRGASHKPFSPRSNVHKPECILISSLYVGVASKPASYRQ
jgi:hypothetical protein